MRTTLDLPDELMKRAKIAAIRRGDTLREFVASALTRELAEGAAPRRARVKLPLIKVSADCPLLSMSPQDLKRIDAEAEAEKLLAVYSGR